MRSITILLRSKYHNNIINNNNNNKIVNSSSFDFIHLLDENSRYWNSRSKISTTNSAVATTTATTQRLFSSSTINNSNNNSNNDIPKIQLYQYAICPFCNRVKALLDYASIQYTTIEVNPLTKSEIKPFKQNYNYNKVPIATITASDTSEDQPLLGSDVIIKGLLQEQFVQEKLKEKWTTTTTTNNNNNEIMTLEKFINNDDTTIKWTDYAVNELATLLYPNMCKTYTDSYNAFNYVHNVENNFNVIQKILIQSLGSLAMYFAASKVKKKRNITDERKALEESLIKLETTLEKQSYLTSEYYPTLADINVYGVLRSIDGLPVHNDIIINRKNNNSPIPDWYRRMKQQTTTMQQK